MLQSKGGATLLSNSGYVLALVALNAHSLLTMPPWQPDTWERIVHMVFRDFDDIEPWAYAVFVMFGMWSLLLAALILLDGWYQRLPAWPFALSMMVLGPSMVLLYQLFRQDHGQPWRTRNRLENLARVKCLGLVIMLITVAALWEGYAGDLHRLWQQFCTDYFTHAMLVDEMLFLLLTPILVHQDCRRQQRNPAWVWGSLLLPIVGGCAYLMTRVAEPDYRQ